jgi:hypothetical protein
MTRALSVLLLSCASLAGAATLTLTPGQTGRLGASTVTLLRVQDSRCPINARCVRAGELRTTVLLTAGHRSRLLHLQFPAGPMTGAGLRIAGATDAEAGKRAPVRVTLSDRPT